MIRAGSRRPCIAHPQIVSYFPKYQAEDGGGDGLWVRPSVCLLVGVLVLFWDLCSNQGIGYRCTKDTCYKIGVGEGYRLVSEIDETKYF